MNKTDFQKIISSPVFIGGNPDTIQAVLDEYGCSADDFSASSTVCTPISEMRSVGVVLSGKAAVYSYDGERRVLLRILSSGDIFGVANVFSETDRFVSTIIAKSRCRIFFIPAEAMSKLLRSDDAILKNYIEFLSGRIRFLNRKIMYFTSGTAERRLALYLSSFGTSEVVPEVPISSLADMLDIGRASLYRAFDRLSGDGFIIKNGNVITLLEPDKMLKFYK